MIRPVGPVSASGPLFVCITRQIEEARAEEAAMANLPVSSIYLPLHWIISLPLVFVPHYVGFSIELFNEDPAISNKVDLRFPEPKFTTCPRFGEQDELLNITE